MAAMKPLAPMSAARSDSHVCTVAAVSMMGSLVIVPEKIRISYQPYQATYAPASGHEQPGGT